MWGELRLGLIMDMTTATMSLSWQPRAWWRAVMDGSYRQLLSDGSEGPSLPRRQSHKKKSLAGFPVRDFFVG
jgi:hypothetical protein